MFDADDKTLLKFIATTVENLRERMDTISGRVDMISEQMATKVDLANLRDELRAEMATKEELAGLESRLRADMATKHDVSRLETTMHGEFEQVHIRFDSVERALGTRMGQVEIDISRLRSVLYLLVKDKPDMLRLLGQPTPGESRPQG